MQLTSALAIYFLFWVMSAFFVLPFGCAPTMTNVPKPSPAR